MAPKRFVLRSLPGVMDVENLIHTIQAHPNPHWAPENDQLPDVVDRVSMRLFGINQQDTEFKGDELSGGDWYAAYEVWEQNFAFAEFYFDDGGDESQQDALELEIWTLLGWDVTDGSGKPLECVAHFERQIICATKGLAGHLPGAEPTDEEALAAAERWAQTLMAGDQRPARKQG
jgi:hypothetical protein